MDNQIVIEDGLNYEALCRVVDLLDDIKQAMLKRTSGAQTTILSCSTNSIDYYQLQDIVIFLKKLSDGQYHIEEK